MKGYTRIMEFLKKIIDLIIEFFKYKSVKETNEVKKENIEFQDNVDENFKKKQKKLDKAIEDRDEDAINTLVNMSLIVSLLFFSGCITKEVPVYIPSNQKIVFMENENKEPGYWVPENKFKELVSYKLKWQAYLEEKKNAERK